MKIFGVGVMILLALIVNSCFKSSQYNVISANYGETNAIIVLTTENKEEALGLAHRLDKDQSNRFVSVGTSPCRTEGSADDYLYICDEVIFRSHKPIR